MTDKLDQIIGGTYEVVDLRVLVSVKDWDSLLAEIEALKQALAFYAGWKNWMPEHTKENRVIPSKAVKDAGEIARKALGEGE